MKTSGTKIKCEKAGMSQIWNEKGEVAPVTLLKCLDDEKVFSLIQVNQRLSVKGISKGKGFQGVVKRHGFHGGPKTHGQKDRLRAPGSIGPTAPQRTIKGRKMAGRMGGVKKTVKNLLVVKVKPEDKLILVKGAVPGVKGRMVEVKF